jgi:hypothetical protein
MLLKEAGERPLQLTGSVTVNHADRPLIGQQRFIEEPLGARQRFVDAAPDDVQICGGRVARLQIDGDLDLSGSRRCAADDLQIANARPHPFAADVDLGGVVVNGGDDPFEAEAADDHAIANRRLPRRG